MWLAQGGYVFPLFVFLFAFNQVWPQVHLAGILSSLFVLFILLHGRTSQLTRAQ